jgi:hypothetical protein
MSDPGPATPSKAQPPAEPWMRRLPQGLLLTLGAIVLLLAEIILWARGLI